MKLIKKIWTVEEEQEKKNLNIDWHNKKQLALYFDAKIPRTNKLNQNNPI